MPSIDPHDNVLLNDKRVIRAWALFDWANSAFALVITVAIFPGYYIAVTDDYIPILGIEVANSALYAYAISASYLVIASISPLLSGIADFGGKKKFFLQGFTILGASACLSLFFFQGMDQIWLGNVGFILAMIGFAGGLVFYNSYLPEIVTEDRYDSVSAMGFAYGYAGSLILLISNLILIFFHEDLGLSESFATRLAFVMVGIWWLGFASIPFRVLPRDRPMPAGDQLFRRGLGELRKVWHIARGAVNIRRFLLAFFCYSAGVQTVLFLAATFAEKELDFGTMELIIVIILLQLVAIFGAYLFARISALAGNKASLILMLGIWIVICLGAYFVQTNMAFYGVAAAVGLVMGGIQSLSRSTYSKLLPPETEDTTSFFSFYDVLEKVAIVLGTFTFGFINQMTGSMRSSILLLSVFFLIALIVMSSLKIKPPAAAGSQPEQPGEAPA